MTNSETSVPQKRREKGRFVPGVVYNPGGRPQKNRELTAALEAACPEAARKLIGLLDSADEKIVLQACTAILDRVLGKPTQQVVTQETGGVLLNLIAAFQARQLPPVEEGHD